MDIILMVIIVVAWVFFGTIAFDIFIRFVENTLESFMPAPEYIKWSMFASDKRAVRNNVRYFYTDEEKK